MTTRTMTMIAQVHGACGLAGALGLVIFATAACRPKTQAGAGSQSIVYEMSESGNRPVEGFSATWAASNGYFDGKDCSSYLKGGEPVAFSASYETEGEAGQAYGHTEKDGDRYLFVQEDMPTTQAMFPPGLGEFSGKSLWDLGSYFKTVCSVAFGRGRSGADYASPKAEIISMTGGTAGKTVSYNDALKISFNASTNGGTTDVIIVLAKGLGPRVVEFRESNMPAGTAKVYIGDNSGGGSSL